MAVIRNTAAMRLRGKIGNTTYYTQGRRQVARVSENSSNYGEDARRSLKQQQRRVKWANVVNLYRASASWINGAFEFKKPNQSDYNRFMQLNYPIATCALTKPDALTGASVLQIMYVSEGSLTPIQITLADDVFQTSLKTSFDGQTIQNKSIADFTADMIEHNPYLKAGMQLTLLVYTQLVDTLGIPRVEANAYELTLDLDNEAKLTTNAVGARLGALTQDTKHVIGLTRVGTDAWVAMIVSDSTSGTLRVSSAMLVPGDMEIWQQYSSESMVEQAVKSYGVDSARFLDSGDMPSNI